MGGKGAAHRAGVAGARGNEGLAVAGEPRRNIFLKDQELVGAAAWAPGQVTRLAGRDCGPCRSGCVC